MKVNQSDYDLVMIVTHQNNRFITRLRDTLQYNNQVRILLIAVAQNTESNWDDAHPYNDIHIIHTGTCGLSHARNQGIGYLLDNGIVFGHIMFPDDDTTFDAAFFEQYHAVVQPSENYLIDVYCEGTKTLYVTNKITDSGQVGRSGYHAAMSVNMIISYVCFTEVGKFDPQLGVGAKYGAAEDMDYFLRAVAISGHFTYSKRLYNFHPSPGNKYASMTTRQIISRFVGYGNGVIYAMCKHKMYRSALVVCLRAMAGSAYNMLKGNFRLAAAYFVSFFHRCRLTAALYVNNSRQ